MYIDHLLINYSLSFPILKSSAPCPISARELRPPMSGKSHTKVKDNWPGQTRENNVQFRFR